MCRVNTQIEDRLHSAGYKTDRTGDVVRVYDPVKADLGASVGLVVTHWDLHEIRTSRKAWSFINARS